MCFYFIYYSTTTYPEQLFNPMDIIGLWVFLLGFSILRWLYSSDWFSSKKVINVLEVKVRVVEVGRSYLPLKDEKKNENVEMEGDGKVLSNFFIWVTFMHPICPEALALLKGAISSYSYAMKETAHAYKLAAPFKIDDSMIMSNPDDIHIGSTGVLTIVMAKTSNQNGKAKITSFELEKESDPKEE